MVFNSIRGVVRDCERVVLARWVVQVDARRNIAVRSTLAPARPTPRGRLVHHQEDYSKSATDMENLRPCLIADEGERSLRCSFRGRAGRIGPTIERGEECSR